MSTHPNVILMAVFTPDNTTRKTLRAIVAGATEQGLWDDLDKEIKIGDAGYRPVAMEGDYYKPDQIAAKDGDIVFFDLVTYGYGKWLSWDELSEKKERAGGLGGGRRRAARLHLRDSNLGQLLVGMVVATDGKLRTG